MEHKKHINYFQLVLFPFELSSCECCCLPASERLCPLLNLSPHHQGISAREQEVRESTAFPEPSWCPDGSANPACHSLSAEQAGAPPECGDQGQGWMECPDISWWPRSKSHDSQVRASSPGGEQCCDSNSYA